MRKILTLVLITVETSAFAISTNSTNNESNPYVQFQTFDRQYNLGFGVVSGNVTNGSNGGVYNDQYINFEAERLFNVGVWLDVNASLFTYYSENQDPNVPEFGSVTGSQPFFGGINAKVGYAFPLIKDTLLITPYGLLGRNTNLATYTLSGAPNTTNLTEDYFWSFGGGARLEYRLSDIFDFYVDQNMVYNASQAPITQGMNPNDNYTYMSILGAKFNLYRNFQLGGQVFYTGNYYTQSLNTIYGEASVPQNSVGGLISVGLTY